MELICICCGKHWSAQLVLREKPEDFDRQGANLRACPSCHGIEPDGMTEYQRVRLRAVAATGQGQRLGKDIERLAASNADLNDFAFGFNPAKLARCLQKIFAELMDTGRLKCEPTAHRRAFSDSSSWSFRRIGPTAHRGDWWRWRLLFAMLGCSFASVPSMSASVRQCRWLRGKPHKLVEKHALLCPTTGLGRHSPAMVPRGRAGWNRHQPALKASVPADIHGGDVVAEE